MRCREKDVHMPWVVWWLRPQSVGAHLLQPRSVLEGDPTPSLRLFTGTPHREVAQLEPSPSCPSQTRRSSKPMESIFPNAKGLLLSSLKFQFH